MRLLIILVCAGMSINSWSQVSETDFFAQGKKAADAKNYSLAIENYKKVVAQKPESGEAWFEMGWCYDESGNYTEAIKALANAKQYLKDQARVFFESGYANQNGGDIEEAISDFRKCIQLDAYYSSAYRYLAGIFQDSKKDYKTASGYYNQFVNYSREADISAKTWYKKGFCENEMEQYEDAVESLKRAVAVDSKYAEAYNELGYAYSRMGKGDESIQSYTASKNLDGQSSIPCAGIGDIFRTVKKDPEAALKNYLDGVKLNSASVSCNYGAGWCYNEKQNYSAAISYLQKAVETNNQYAPAYTELGYAYYSLQRYDEAMTALNHSVNLLKSSTPYYYLGLCYVAKKQKVQAQEIYRKLLDLNATDAGNLLSKINAMP